MANPGQGLHTELRSATPACCGANPDDRPGARLHSIRRERAQPPGGLSGLATEGEKLSVVPRTVITTTEPDAKETG